MDTDSEQINKKKPDDFNHMIVDNIMGIDWYLYITIFIAFLIVVSDIYTHHILQKMNGATKGEDITSFGYMVQAISVVILVALSQIAKKYM